MAHTSIKTIAEELNLSPSTVSIVLNGRGDEVRISKATQERVLEKAKLMGYKPNIHARRLRQKSTGNETAIIGVLWPSQYSSELLVRFFDGIHQSILEDKINVEVVYKPYKFSDVQNIGDVFKNNLFNGVIVVGASDDDVEYISNENSLMPIVFFNRQNEKYSSVCVDDYSCGNKVAELFYARGHKEVGLVASDLRVRSHSLRSAGFIDGCKRLGIDLLSSNFIKDFYNEEGGKRVALQLVKTKKLPTAIFFTQGTTAPGVYPVFEENGIKIPEDIEILGYADTALTQLTKPSLSVIDLPIQIIVKKCIHLLLDMINGRIQQHVTIYEDTYFIFRESCGGFPEK